MTMMFAGRDLIVPSTVGKVKPLASPAEEWKWAVEGLKEVAAFAQDNGLTAGIEPLNRFETYFINRHDQALRLAEEVGHDLRVVLDAFHINIEEVDWKQAIRNTGDRLLDFHAADNNRRPCGQGRYDWSEVVSVLKEVNSGPADGGIRSDAGPRRWPCWAKSTKVTCNLPKPI